MRAVIYARISEDHEKAESVPTQIANGSSTLSEWAGTWCGSSKTRGSPAIPARRGRVRGDAEAPQQRAGRRAGRAASRPADPHPDDFARLMRICEKSKVKISLYTGGELDLSTASSGFYGFMETGTSWYESAIRSLRVKDAIERNVRAGRRVPAVWLQDHPARPGRGSPAQVAHRRRGAGASRGGRDQGGGDPGA
jgi:hypothetical protein